MKINIGNREFEVLECFYNVIDYQITQKEVSKAFFSNLFDINNPIQYCVINYILKPTEKR